MDISTQLTEILKKENYTFQQLADFLGMDAGELTAELNNKTLPLRKLELISKALRVPLYSFFREVPGPEPLETPYYVNNLWTSGDATKSDKELETEIALLRQILQQKEEQLKKGAG